MKIGRLENLCRALQEERNELYKKIREAKLSEKDDQGQHSSDEERESAVPAGEAADPEASRVHDAVQSLAAAFRAIQGPESDGSGAFPAEPGSPQGGADPPLNESERGNSEGPLPTPTPQADAEARNEAQLPPKASHPATEPGAEPQGRGFPAGAQADQPPPEPEAEACSRAPEAAVEASLRALEAKGPAAAPPAGERVPAGAPGCEPPRQPPAAGAAEASAGARGPAAPDPSPEGAH